MLHISMLIVFGFLALCIVAFPALYIGACGLGLATSLFQKLSSYFRALIFGRAPEPVQVHGPHVDDSADPYRRGTFIRY